jgi:hypothetical protein
MNSTEEIVGPCDKYFVAVSSRYSVPDTSTKGNFGPQPVE